MFFGMKTEFMNTELESSYFWPLFENQTSYSTSWLQSNLIRAACCTGQKQAQLYYFYYMSLSVF